MGELVEKVDVKRVGDNGETSLGVMYLDGIAVCGSVEDQEQKGDKIKHESRVSNGVYKLALREEGGFHSKYKKRYDSKHGEGWHKGMLCVYTDKNWVLRCPDGKVFQYILVHTGNTDDHTSGCLLPNYVLDFLNDKGSRSGDAYEKIYPILRDSILNSDLVDEWGNKYIEIEYSDVEDGK
jgi:hypothetical protein